MAKPGRPRLPTSEKRIQTSTTLPSVIYDKIIEKRYAVNELVMDGLNHRENCLTDSGSFLNMQEKLKRLLKKLESYANFTEEKGLADQFLEFENQELQAEVKE